MDWAVIKGFEALLLAFFLTSMPMWFALLQYRVRVFMWIISPLLAGVLTGIGMIVIAALAPVLTWLTRTPKDGIPVVVMALTTLALVGYFGGLAVAYPRGVEKPGPEMTRGLERISTVRLRSRSD